MLLMVEEEIRGGICHSIHRYAKANNKYMKNYNKNIESSYIQYLDANNLYGWAMSQKLPANNFKCAGDTLKINEDFIKNYCENSRKGYIQRIRIRIFSIYILAVDVKYPKELRDLHSDLPFLQKKMKIDKCKKLVCDLHNKKICSTYKVIKTSIKSWIKIKKSS